MKHLFAGLAVVTLVAPATAELPDGHWRLSQHVSTLADQRLFVLKVETKEGKPTATVTDSMKQFVPKGQEPKAIEVRVTEFKVDGKQVTLAADMGVQKLMFEGTLDGKDKNTVFGSIDNGRALSRGKLTMQDGDKLVPLTAAERPKAPEPYLAAQKFSTATVQLQIRAQQAKDPIDRAELMAEIKKARAEADEKMPPLFKETVEKHADSPYAVEAATQLLRSAARTKALPPDVDKWVNLIDADASRYGPKFARESAVFTAEILNGQAGYGPIALKAASKGTEGLNEKIPLAAQSRALKALKAAQSGAGKVNEAKETDIRLAKVEAALDEEYLRTVPPFKPEKFAGRKDQTANRVAVMELFTGATCPPCVAADAAFDALEKAYEPKDLVLIQYHMHIPGPDTLTNLDTIARWDYYREKFGMQIRGVPSSLFNGKPVHGGGGGMANSRTKFDEYTATINELLENATDVKVTGSAKRTGDKVSVALGIEMPEANDNVKVRVLLVEERVRYAGSNGMRFHHQVVRAMPAGGSKGTPLVAKSTRVGADVDLAELRKDLNKYLDDFSAERPFPNPDRPMEMAHLKIIALVQNDATGEILNAAEFPVEGK